MTLMEANSQDIVDTDVIKEYNILVSNSHFYKTLTFHVLMVPIIIFGNLFDFQISIRIFIAY